MPAFNELGQVLALLGKTGVIPRAAAALDSSMQNTGTALRDAVLAEIPAFSASGNPVGKSCTVKADGSLIDGGGANPTSGYSLIEASSLDDAHKKAKGCPLLKAGGSIEIAPVMDM